MSEISKIEIDNLWNSFLADKPEKTKRLISRAVNKLDLDKRGYLSHTSALFLHELPGGTSSRLIITTGSFKKNRSLKACDVVIHHAAETPAGIVQEMETDDAVIRVSSVESTLVDLVSEAELAPELPIMAQLFSGFSGNARKVIALAQKKSDSALKRCLFWFLWCGKIDARHAARYKLSATPVHLDRRYPQNQLWEGLCKVYYPDFLLGLPIENAVTKRSDENDEWQELRSFSPFCDYCRHNCFLPILNDKRPRKIKLLKGFMHSACFFRALPGYDELMLEIFDVGSATKNSSRLPQICLKSLRDDIGNEKNFPWLRKWVVSRLRKSEPGIFEVALYYAVNLGLAKDAVTSLEKRGMDLVKIEAFTTLKKVCQMLIDTDKKQPPEVYRFLALGYRRAGDFRSAMKILKNGLKFCAHFPNRSTGPGDLNLSLGSVYLQMNKFKTANKALAMAADNFLANAPEKLGGVLLMRGNAYFMHGKLSRARNLYLHAKKEFVRHSKIEFQAKAVYNLALIEYRRENYRSSAIYFAQAAKIYRQLESKESMLEAMQNQAVCWLNLGQARNAVTILEKALSELNSLPEQSPATRVTLLSFLAWAYQTSGFTDTSSDFISDLSRIEPKPSAGRTGFISNLLPAMCQIMEAKFDLAEKYLQTIITGAKFHEMPASDQAETLFRLGQIKTLQDHKEGNEYLIRAENLLKENSQAELKHRIILFHAMKFPGTFETKQINRAIKAINLAGTFDPFWLFYANELSRLNLVSGYEFIKNHRRATSANLIQSYCNALPDKEPELKKLFSAFTAKRQALLVSERGCKILTPKQARTWQPSAENLISFDFSNGIIVSGNRKMSLKSRCQHAKILRELIKSNFLPYREIYEKVWNTPYDSEWDEPTLKAAIYRLRRMLQPIQDRIRLLPRSRNGQRGLRLKISGKWEAML